LRGNWQDFNWHDASRGLSAIAELFVLTTRSTCRSEIFWVLSLLQHSGGKCPFIWIYANFLKSSVGLGYVDGTPIPKISFIRPVVSIQYQLVTDRQTGGDTFPHTNSVLSTPLCTWRRPCARKKMQASTNFIMSVCLFFRYRRVCCEQRALHWVRWLYELAGQLRVYLYGWIHWRRIQLHRCVSVFVFNNNKWICNESTTNK